MVAIEKSVDYVSAPRDYAELFQVYYHYVVKLVGKYGIEEQSREDVASDILLRFYERDFLTKFDPDMVFHYDGKDYPANFKTFLTAFVKSYARSYRDRQLTRQRRELFLLDRSLPVSFNGVPTVLTWYDLFEDLWSNEMSSIDEVIAHKSLVRKLRDHLVTVPRRSSTDRCDLVALFDEIATQVWTTGKCPVKHLQQRFGISSTAVQHWLAWLRLNMVPLMLGETL